MVLAIVKAATLYFRAWMPTCEDRVSASCSDQKIQPVRPLLMRWTTVTMRTTRARAR